MLTKRHIEILRAAVKFFDEEMTPHGQDVARYYFDSPQDGELRPSELEELQDILRRVELRYARCEVTAPQLIGQALLSQVEVEIEASRSEVCRIATILLPVSK